jgi:uncharacterized membrane protein YeiH
MINKKKLKMVTQSDLYFYFCIIMAGIFAILVCICAQHPTTTSIVLASLGYVIFIVLGLLSAVSKRFQNFLDYEGVKEK